MAREKIKIKRIENLTARQVTLSKRRRGIFKKGQDLSVLCDAQVAIIIFSATGKLTEYSSSNSNMEDAIAKYNLHKRNLDKNQQPSPELKLDGSGHISLSKETTDNSFELRTLRENMKAEELEGLSMEELEQKEEELQAGLTCLLHIKGERMMAELDDLHKKTAGLEEQNIQLKQKVYEPVALICEGKRPVMMSELDYTEEGESSESIITHISTDSPSAEDDFSDTSLKLGLPLN